jgi:hypothetical protein
MSPTYGIAPPSLGAADLRVDPQALWDVGLALQQVRDSANTLRLRASQWHQWASEQAFPDDLAEVASAWQRLGGALVGAGNGLYQQTEGLVGVLDETMTNLKLTILRYLEAEAHSGGRIRDAAGGWV